MTPTLEKMLAAWLDGESPPRTKRERALWWLVLLELRYKYYMGRLALTHHDQAHWHAERVILRLRVYPLTSVESGLVSLMVQGVAVRRRNRSLGQYTLAIW